MALIAASAVLAVGWFARSASSDRAAIRAGHDRVLVETARAAHWRERDAILADAFQPTPAAAAAKRSAIAQFRRALDGVVVDNDAERSAVRALRASNEALIAASRSDGGTMAERLEGLARRSDRLLAQLDRLDALNIRETTEAEARASSDASTAKAIAVGAFGVMVVLACIRTFFLTRLVRSIAVQNEELRRLDSVKDELIATVSHEFRTPLTSVQGYLELLEDEAGELSDDHMEYIAIARRSAHRLLRLVNDLLLLAEIDDRRFVLDRSSVELSSLVRRAVDSARPVAAHKELSLDVRIEDGVPPIEGDAPRLAQVVDNLIGNAIKFTAEGGVEVSLARVDGSAVIRVADTGIGIPEDEAEQLFERFYRARAAREGAIAGTGLGLAIAKAIVDEHDGEIAAAPNERGGTTFSVRLPLATG